MAEYLLAAHSLADKPTTEDFMLLADGNDPNPTMIIRYQTYLEAQPPAARPGAGDCGTALAALPDDRFAAEASAVVTKLIAGATPEKSMNPLVAGMFSGRPLKELADAAKIYGELLSGVDQMWQEAVSSAKAAGEPGPGGARRCELGRVATGVRGSPAANLSPSDIGVLALLIDRGRRFATI